MTRSVYPDLDFSGSDLTDHDREIRRLSEACRRGDGHAAILMARHARRAQDFFLMKTAIAGVLLCEDVMHPCQALYALFIAAQVNPTPMWEVAQRWDLDYMERAALEHTQTVCTNET